MVNLTSTEEENTEFLKTLWDKYKYLALIGILVVVSSIIAIEKSSSNKIIFNQETSELYSDFIQSIDQVEIDSIKKGNEFIDAFPNSVYARLVALQVAKLYYEKEDMEKASEKLDWIIENTNSGIRKKYDPIQVTAKYRRAILSLDQGRFNESIAIFKR